MTTLISIIVPVYNVEKYIERCIESILKQTYRNYELILIDDGSTDNSGAICDKYEKEDSRIKVIHKKNGGQSSARNTGIKVMSGEYVTFIDSDDYVHPKYIEILYNTAKSENADIAAVSYKLSFALNYSNDSFNERDFNIYSYNRKEAIEELLTMGKINQMVWGKLYKRYIFEHIRFPKGFAEDLAVIFDMILISQKVVCIDAELYVYYVREGSSMQSDFTAEKYCEIDIIDKKMDMIEKIYPELTDKCNGRRLTSYFKTLHRIMSSYDKKEHLHYVREIKKKVNQKGKGLLMNRRISGNLKIKIIAFKLGVNSYESVQKFSDRRKQKQSRHNYIV